MSCNCTHIDYYNPCTCGKLVVNTSTTTTTTTLCLNGEKCEDVIDDFCVIYNGPDINCYGIKTGDTALDILKIILGKFTCP